MDASPGRFFPFVTKNLVAFRSMEVGRICCSRCFPKNNGCPGQGLLGSKVRLGSLGYNPGLYSIYKLLIIHLPSLKLTYIASENRPSRKEINLPTIDFQGLC